jgi:hypothetical protein
VCAHCVLVGSYADSSMVNDLFTEVQLCLTSLARWHSVKL